ncbi:hypothetical protein HKBW3S42_02145, partial [Candidatus Hakubella thermalkaliphila]
TSDDTSASPYSHPYPRDWMPADLPCYPSCLSSPAIPVTPGSHRVLSCPSSRCISLRLGKRGSALPVPPSLEGRCDDATSGFTLVTACEFASPGHARVCRVASTIGVTPYGCTPRYPGEQAIPGVGLSPTSHESSTAHFPDIQQSTFAPLSPEH